MLAVVCVTLFGCTVSTVHTQDTVIPATTQRAAEYPSTDPLNFTEWKSNAQYISTTMTNPKGMEPLYNITTMILDFFLGSQPIPDGYIVVSDMKIEFGEKVRQHKWLDLLKHYWPILLVVLVAAVFIVMMPVIGLCVCCCRCAGGCGGRAQAYDKKYDTCRRILFGLILIVVATALIFSTIVAFATNYLLQQGVENATTTARYGVADTKTFFRATSAQANHLLETNYNDLTRHLELVLTGSSEYVVNKLRNESNAHSLYLLTEFADSLPKFKKDLERMRFITNGLRANATELNGALNQARFELLNALKDCRSKACKNFVDEYKIGSLGHSDIDYDKVNLLHLLATQTKLNRAERAV